MGLIRRAVANTLQWPQLDPNDERVWSSWAPPTRSGVRMDANRAMTVSAVWAAVRLVSETVGMLPLHVYRRRADGGKEPARDHPIEVVLAQRPNAWQTPMEFREMMQGHVELRGNAYARIVPGRLGPVDQLVPLHPDYVEPEQLENGEIVYHVRDANGQKETYLADEIFHIRGLSSDGVKGLSTIAYARESLGLTSATEEYASRLFGQGTIVRGILKHPDTFKKPDTARRIREDFRRFAGGLGNAGETVVLEEGMDWERIGLTNEDAQFLELREYQVSDIARWFRLPPHTIGDLRRATFTNIENQGLELVVYSLMARFRRWEYAIARSLIMRDDVYFAEFNVDGLLRGDIQSRYRAYAIGRNWGWLSANDIRAKENMNPIPADEGGDTYLQPTNMQPADAESADAMLNPNEPNAVIVGRNGHGAGYDRDH